MTNLISGKEALIALANGEEVQIESNKQWVSVDNCQVYQFLYKSCDYKFRLKPKTITLNGIEVPAPSEPKDYESLWVVDSATPLGYRNIFHHGGCVHFMCWHTENEVKQVVVALRSIFKTN